MVPYLMVSLVGEQPVPNLLPPRYEKVDKVLFVYTDRTRPVYDRVKPLLECETDGCEVPPYEMQTIRDTLYQRIVASGIDSHHVVFNLTGGTKPMAFAAYGLAAQFGSPFVYLQSEGGRSVLFRFSFVGGNEVSVEKVELPALITIDDYLRVHLGRYIEAGPKGRFEALVADALKPVVNELKSGVDYEGRLEIDLVLRCGNQIGIAEAKGGRRADKSGIDQLVAAADPRFLGTYVHRFWIVAASPSRGNLELARAHHINVIQIPSGSGGSLSDEDRQTLIDAVRRRLVGAA